MDKSNLTWHNRFLQQARWTKEIRRYLFERIGISQSSRIIELGCGTGAILKDLGEWTKPCLYGLDINHKHLKQATKYTPGTLLIQGDVAQTPFENRLFDASICHFLLLWLADPLQAIVEMKRIVKIGGHVLALAEPDYGGRIDYPVQLERIGDAQIESLKSQGADPLMGRKLSEIFYRAGLQQVEVGILGGQWHAPPSQGEWQLEWAVIESDIGNLITDKEFEHLKKLDAQSWKQGMRILFVPTFYAAGRVVN